MSENGRQKIIERTEIKVEIKTTIRIGLSCNDKRNEDFDRGPEELPDEPLFQPV